MAGRDISVGIAGACIDHLSLQINWWSRPDRPACRYEHLCPRGILLVWLREILNGIALPNDLSGSCMERDNASTKCATLVFCITPGSLFEGRDRHINPILIEQ